MLPRRDSNSRNNTSSIRGLPLAHRGDRPYNVECLTTWQKIKNMSTAVLGNPEINVVLLMSEQGNTSRTQNRRRVRVIPVVY